MDWFVLRHIPKKDVDLFRKIERVLGELPDTDLGQDKKGNPVLVSCHMLARAIAKAFPGCKARDGLFMQRWEHSWVALPEFSTLDPYPIALLGGPILFPPREPSLPWFYLYSERPLPWLEGLDFWYRVGLVTENIKKTMARLEIHP